MTNKFDNILKFLNNPPKELDMKTLREYVEILPEMDNGVRAGRDLLQEWMEIDEETMHSCVDKLSTAALSMLQYKRLATKVEDVPEPLKEIIMTQLIKKQMEETSAETVVLSSLAWMMGFLLGLEFYRSVIADPNDYES